MLYPDEVIKEVHTLQSSPALRRAINLYKNVFGYLPSQIGGYYDAMSILTNSIRFAVLYNRERMKKSVKTIKRLRKQIRELSHAKTRDN